MATPATPEEIKWWWWAVSVICGIFVGVFSAGMYSQRLLGKYITKEMLDEKCDECKAVEKATKEHDDKAADSLSRELQNIHAAISAQGDKMTKLGNDVAFIKGRLQIGSDSG